MSNHSIIEHRANYFYIPLEDDYLAMYEKINKEIESFHLASRRASGPADCKAMIASVLEHWMNSKRKTATCEDDLYVYLTYEEWEHQLRYRYKRSIIIRCLDEMLLEGQILDEKGEIEVGTIKKKPYVQNTYAYILNVRVVQGLIAQLPEQSPYGAKPKATLGRPRKNRVKINGLIKNDIILDDIPEIPSKNTSNNEEYRVKINDCSIHRLPNTDLPETQIEGSAFAPTPPLFPSNVTLLSDSQKMRVAKPATPHSQMAHDEERPAVQEWDSDGLASTAKVPAVPKGASDGLSDTTPSHHSERGDSGNSQSAVNSVRPMAVSVAPAIHPSSPAALPPVQPAYGGAVAPDVRGASDSEQRAPGANLRESEPRTLTRKQQERLNDGVTAEYWAVIEQWKGAKYTRDQRESASHKSGIEAMLANGVLPDDLKAKLGKLDGFQRRTFTVNKLYLDWWNNLDEAVKPGANGKTGKSKPVAPINNGYSLEMTEEDYARLGVVAS